MYSKTMDNSHKNQVSGNDGRMRIGQFARSTGVSRETVHFYLREGLLPPPEKVNARVAYFDEGHLARMRLIKRLQQVHLPLASIKEHIQAMEGHSTTEIELFIPKLTDYLSIDGDEAELSVDEIVEQTGLTREQIARLEELGVLRPRSADGTLHYTQAERNAAAAAKMLLDQGVELEDLRFLQRHAELIEQEHGFILHHLILPALAAGRRDQVSATRGFQALRTIEAYLRRQFRRQYGMFTYDYDQFPDPLRKQGSTQEKNEP
jgi:DNA-binding transcriptional MerR regulator